MYENLAKIMKSDNISQRQIAELLEVRQATISDKMTGKTRFYFDEAIKIKKVFFPHYEMEYLFENTEK